MESLTLTAFGRTVALSGDVEQLVAARQLLPAAYRSVEAEPECLWSLRAMDHGWEVLVNGVPVNGLSRPDQDMAWDAAVSHLEMWVAEHADTYTFVHAACAVVDGGAIIIPSYSMGGKSTLIGALVRAGAEYFSDDLVLLDARGAVRPYRRPLSVRQPDGRLERVTAPAPPSTGWSESAEAAVLAILMYHPVDGWRVSNPSAAQALLHLLPHAVTAQIRPDDTLAATSRVVAQAVTLLGTRDDADSAAERLMEIARRQRRSSDG